MLLKPASGPGSEFREELSFDLLPSHRVWVCVCVRARAHMRV